MKQVFKLIALFMGLTLLFLCCGVIFALYVSSVIGYVCYGIAGACFIVLIIFVVLGFVNAKSKKDENV